MRKQRRVKQEQQCSKKSFPVGDADEFLEDDDNNYDEGDHEKSERGEPRSLSNLSNDFQQPPRMSLPRKTDVLVHGDDPVSPINLITGQRTDTDNTSNDDREASNWNTSTTELSRSSICRDECDEAASFHGRCPRRASSLFCNDPPPFISPVSSDDNRTEKRPSILSPKLVDIFIYYPYYPDNQKHITTCRILTLPIPVPQSIRTLASNSISIKSIDKLPTSLKAFSVPENTVVALEFFRDIGSADHMEDDAPPSSPAVCVGRIFIPSRLLHIVATQCLTPEGEPRLRHLISEALSRSISISVPLTFCGPDLPPPSDENEAEAHFLNVTKLESSRPEIRSPVIRFLISAHVPLIAPRDSVSSGSHRFLSARSYASASPTTSPYRSLKARGDTSTRFKNVRVPLLVNLPSPTAANVCPTPYYTGRQAHTRRDSVDSDLKRSSRKEYDVMGETPKVVSPSEAVARTPRSFALTSASQSTPTSRRHEEHLRRQEPQNGVSVSVHIYHHTSPDRRHDDERYKDRSSCRVDPIPYNEYLCLEKAVENTREREIRAPLLSPGHAQQGSPLLNSSSRNESEMSLAELCRPVPKECRQGQSKRSDQTELREPFAVDRCLTSNTGTLDEMETMSRVQPVQCFECKSQRSGGLSLTSTTSSSLLPFYHSGEQKTSLDRCEECAKHEQERNQLPLRDRGIESPPTGCCSFFRRLILLMSFSSISVISSFATWIGRRFIEKFWLPLANFFRTT